MKRVGVLLTPSGALKMARVWGAGALKAALLWFACLTKQDKVGVLYIPMGKK